MTSPRLRLSNVKLKFLCSMRNKAQERGDLRTMKRISAVLGVFMQCAYATVSLMHGVSEEAIRLWVIAFAVKGIEGLQSKKSPGRKPKLTSTQKKELDQILTKGPEHAGFPGACWRSPMIQHLIWEKFGVLYSAFYIAQLLKNMGFSYQKARFVSDHLNPECREEWLRCKWPEIIQKAEVLDAYILFGDEASFPQWGTLSYTWAKIGQQPTVQTSGIRKGYKVFGLIDYFSGRFFHKGHSGRLTSETYSQFLSDVLEKSDKHIILIQDGARYHTSKEMKAFFERNKDRLTVEQLPSYSPDYNPIEKLWKEIKKDGIHLHYFPTFEALIEKVEETLISFAKSSRKILSLFGFYRDLRHATNSAA
jgi:transposase